MANNFTTDPSCKALWRFESGALTTDSKGSNTLTNVGVTADTTNYWEGSAAALFNKTEWDYFYIDDANLGAGFPMKKGDTQKVISLAFILKFQSTSALQYIYNHNFNSTETKPFFVYTTSANELKIMHSYNNVNDTESFGTGLTLISGHVYYIGVAHDGVAKTLLVRVYDATAASATTYTYTWTNQTYVSTSYDGRLYIGGNSISSGSAITGTMDELVVFNELKTVADFDDIRNGTYSYGNTTGTADFFVPCVDMDADETAGTASFFVPLPHMEADTVGTAECNCPKPSCTGYSTEGTLGAAEFEIPKPVVDASAYYTIGTATFEVPNIEVTALGGDRTVIEVPLVQVQASGLTGTVGMAVLEVPLPGLTADSASAVLNIPLPQVIAAGLTGTIGTLNAEVPLVDVDASGLVETRGTASISIPIVQVYGEASKDTFSTASIQIPLTRVSGSAYAGTLGNASITVPIPDIEALGYADTIGTASITVPLASVTGSIQEAVVIVQTDGTTESLTGYALVLNLRNNGLTEYDNYPFNSFAYFNGQYLGASSSGIYVLGSDDDDGTAIDSKVQTGMSDEGTALRKAVEDAFLGLSASGVMTAKVVTDGMISYDGSPITQRDDTLITERVKFGKGVRSRYLGLEVENSGGCDFTLESAELIAIPLTRKL